MVESSTPFATLPTPGGEALRDVRHVRDVDLRNRSMAAFLQTTHMQLRYVDARDGHNGELERPVGGGTVLSTSGPMCSSMNSQIRESTQGSMRIDALPTSPEESTVPRADSLAHLLKEIVRCSTSLFPVGGNRCARVSRVRSTLHFLKRAVHFVIDRLTTVNNTTASDQSPSR